MSACNNLGVCVNHDYHPDFECIVSESGAGSSGVDDMRNYDMSYKHLCSVDETSCAVDSLVDPKVSIVSQTFPLLPLLMFTLFPTLFFRLIAIVVPLLCLITNFPNSKL